MKLIIDIPEEYKALFDTERCKSKFDSLATNEFGYVLRKAFENGIPLAEVRTKIDDLRNQDLFGAVSNYDLLDVVLETIDKHIGKTESEEKVRKETIITGLKMTADLLLFDPTTGDEITREQLNRADRITYDSCIGAISILSKNFSRLTEEYIKEYCDKHNLTVIDNDYKEEFVRTWCEYNGFLPPCKKSIGENK